MFEDITKKFEDVQRFFGRGYLTEKNIEEGIRKIRSALLEADVNYKVVKDFIAKVKEKAVGEKILRSASPGDQIVKIVYDELVSLMGPVDNEITIAEKGPTIIMMAGLQGSGKTTTCAKLAKYFREKKNLKPFFVAADTQRPAAIEQLQVLGKTLNIPVFSQPELPPPEICRRSIAEAEKAGCDLVILDTAGRLHIDEDLMGELKQVQKKLSPHNIFFVCDAMVGQDAVKSAKEFNDALELDGVILTKLDGDARGGAALSIKAVTGKPIKFIGEGEQLEKIAEFRPEGMASRILGMGDVIEVMTRLEGEINEEKALQLQEKIEQATFNLEDFKDQIRTIHNIGGVKDLVGMLPKGMLPPGVNSQALEQEIDDNSFVHIEAIIDSMTPFERRNPESINSSRRSRIAKGSGRTVQEVNQLLKQFREMQKMMSKMGKMSGMMQNLMGGMGNMGDLLGKMGNMNMGDLLGKMGGGMPTGMPGAESMKAPKPKVKKKKKKKK